MHPGKLSNIEVSSVRVLGIPAKKRNEGKQVITVIPGLEVFSLENQREIFLIELVNAGILKVTQFTAKF